MQIENIAEKVAEWSGRRFGGLNKTELKAACLHLQISTTAHDTLDSLTRKLLSHYDMWDKPGVGDAASPLSNVGKLSDAVQAAAAPPAPKTKAKLEVVSNMDTSASADAAPTARPRSQRPVTRMRTPPNLRSLVKWEGRRYRIRALAQDKERGGARAIQVAWEGEVYYLRPQLKYQDVPAPVFYNIMDSQAKQLILTWNQQAGVTDREWSEYARFPIQFMGVTPGTGHLPDDLRGWYIEDCKAHNFYEDESRDTLERIWMQLTDGNRPNERDHDRNRDYWLHEIHQLLGLTEEQIEADEQAAALKEQAA